MFNVTVVKQKMLACLAVRALQELIKDMVVPLVAIGLNDS